jgi:hypothetical protein
MSMPGSSSHGFGRWVVRRDGIAVGTVKLARCDVLRRPEVELGYALVPAAWGQGYATGAGAGHLGDGRSVEHLIDRSRQLVHDSELHQHGGPLSHLPTSTSTAKKVVTASWWIPENAGVSPRYRNECRTVEGRRMV